MPRKRCPYLHNPWIVKWDRRLGSGLVRRCHRRSWVRSGHEVTAHHGTSQCVAGPTERPCAVGCYRLSGDVSMSAPPESHRAPRMPRRCSAAGVFRSSGRGSANSRPLQGRSQPQEFQWLVMALPILFRQRGAAAAADTCPVMSWSSDAKRSREPASSERNIKWTSAS